MITERAREIANHVYCVPCNKPVGQLHTDLALALQGKIKSLLSSGLSNDDIYRYFKNIYGQSQVNDGVYFYFSRYTVTMTLIFLIALVAIFLLIYVKTSKAKRN